MSCEAVLAGWMAVMGCQEMGEDVVAVVVALDDCGRGCNQGQSCYPVLHSKLVSKRRGRKGQFSSLFLSVSYGIY